MSLARLRLVACLAGLALVAGATYACTLNPQPLPPGDRAEGGLPTDTAQDAAAGSLGDGGSTFAGSDGGGGGMSDSSLDGGPGATPPATDGGEGDAPTDAPADGPQDGATDGPPDAQEDGG